MKNKEVDPILKDWLNSAFFAILDFSSAKYLWENNRKTSHSLSIVYYHR